MCCESGTENAMCFEFEWERLGWDKKTLQVKRKQRRSVPMLAGACWP